MANLVPKLQDALQALLDNPCPHVPNPPNASRKRASVALILRVDSRHGSNPKTIRDIFEQAKGDPEVLFIKRAGRAGDR